jgi:hypothetical protein
VTFSDFGFALHPDANGGFVGVEAHLSGPGVSEANDTAVVVADPAGTLYLLAREGDPFLVGPAADALGLLCLLCSVMVSMTSGLVVAVRDRPEHVPRRRPARRAGAPRPAGGTGPPGAVGPTPDYQLRPRRVQCSLQHQRHGSGPKDCCHPPGRDARCC